MPDLESYSLPPRDSDPFGARYARGEFNEDLFKLATNEEIKRRLTTRIQEISAVLDNSRALLSLTEVGTGPASVAPNFLDAHRVLLLEADHPELHITLNDFYFNRAILLPISVLTGIFRQLVDIFKGTDQESQLARLFSALQSYQGQILPDLSHAPDLIDQALATLTQLRIQLEMIAGDFQRVQLSGAEQVLTILSLANYVDQNVFLKYLESSFPRCSMLVLGNSLQAGTEKFGAAFHPNRLPDIHIALERLKEFGGVVIDEVRTTEEEVDPAVSYIIANPGINQSLIAWANSNANPEITRVPTLLKRK